MDNIVIIGTSSTASCVFRFIENYSLFNVIGFAVNREYKQFDFFCGKPVYEIESLDSKIDPQKDFLFVGIQWNNLNADRRHVYEKLKNEGYKFANLISPYAVVNGKICGDNCWIHDFVGIDIGAEINNNIHIKAGVWIGEHSVIEDHCFLGAKSTIAGGVHIGQQSFIGLGAVIFDDVNIGSKCIVGAVTALKRNLPDYTVYKTSAEMFVTKTYTKEEIESKLQFKKNIR